MSRSKQFAVFLSLAIVFVLLAACTPPPAPAPAATQPAAAQPAATEAPKVVPTEAPKEAPKAEKLKIAYIRPTNEPYYKYGFDGAQMLADKAGVDLLGYVSEMKAERELASVEDAITQKVDGIVLMSVSATSLAASLNAAKDAGIPVYMLFGYNKDLMDKMVGSVQADCNLSGATIGEWVAKNIPEGEVAVIMGQPGRGDAECYRDSFKAQMEKNPKLKLVAAVPGDWNRQKAFDQMQNLITSNPNLKAVFVQNEDMALGAIQALKQAGKEKDVAIVSQNGAPYGLESIAADGIKATVGWSPSQEAQLALRQLVESVKGQKQPWQLTISPMTVITKDNVGEATPWEPTDASTQATLDLDLSKLKHDFAQAAPGEAAKPEKKLKIAYIRPTNEPYYKYGFDGAQMLADKAGVDLLGYVSEMKAERELASVEDAITQKVDGIVLMSVSATSLAASLNAAKDAGIPVYMLFGYNKDLMDKMVGTVQADCNLSGATIGEWVAKNIPEGEVAVIMGQPGRGDAECYRDSFKAQMEKNPKLKLVAAVPGDWNRQKAFDQMQNLITSNPNLKAVFVQNEDMALGAIQALKQAGKEKDVAIVSQNGAPYGLESIAADGIKATVGWSPSQEAQLALRQLVESINGQKQPWQLTISPMTVITKDNVGEATPWEPTDASTQATLDLDMTKLKHDFAQGAGY